MTCFVAIGQYLKPLSEVEAHYAGHSAWIVAHYEKGMFLASGRQSPPVGGLILFRAPSRSEAESILSLDPFVQKGIARYTLIEFTPGEFPRRSKAFDAFFTLSPELKGHS